MGEWKQLKVLGVIDHIRNQLSPINQDTFDTIIMLGDYLIQNQSETEATAHILKGTLRLTEDHFLYADIDRQDIANYLHEHFEQGDQLQIVINKTSDKEITK